MIGQVVNTKPMRTRESKQVPGARKCRRISSFSGKLDVFDSII